MSDATCQAARILESIERLGASASSLAVGRVLKVRAAMRGELRRIVAVAALALLAVALALGAVGLAAAAVLIAAWPSSPALAATALAVGLLLLALIAMLVIQRSTR